MGGRVADINKPAFEETLWTTFNGRNYSQQIWGNTDDLAIKLKEIFKQAFGDKANEELSLYNLKMKVSRLELLQYEMAVNMVALADEEYKLADKFHNQEYVETLKVQAGILGMSVGSSQAIKAQMDGVINTPFKNVTWSERIWSRQEALRGIVQKATADLVLRGKNPTLAIPQLRKEFDVSVYEAKRLAVTEGARVQMAVQKASFEQMGFEEYEYISEPGACAICRPLDGKHFKVADMQPGLNASPMHPFCRCSTAAHYTGREKKAEETNKVYEGLQGEEIDTFFKKQKSYQKWYNGLSENDKRAIQTYSSGEFDHINALLREGVKNYERARGDRAKTQQVLKEISSIKEAISGYEVEKTFKTYRGVSFYGQDAFLSLKEGKNIVLDKAFLSSSLSLDEIDMFADGGREYRFEITVPKGYNKGAYIAEFSDMPEEKEFVFLPDAKFNIKSIKREKNVAHVIMEAVK